MPKQEENLTPRILEVYQTRGCDIAQTWIDLHTTKNTTYHLSRNSQQTSESIGLRIVSQFLYTAAQKCDD